MRSTERKVARRRGLPTGSITLDDARARVVSEMHPVGRRKTDAEIQAEIDANPDGEPFATVAQMEAGVWTPAVGRTSLTMRIDCAVLNAYKATGKGWQTRMHEVLAGAAPSAADDAGGTLRELERTVLRMTLQVRLLRKSADGLSTAARFVSEPTAKHNVGEPTRSRADTPRVTSSKKR